MCQLLETLKVEQGQVSQLSFHQKRFQDSRQELWPGCHHIDLKKIIDIPASCQNGLYRCRILYDRDIDQITYSQQPTRRFRSLKCVEATQLDYHLKYSDRTAFSKLLAQKGNCDEIIIIQKGHLTDCSIGNLVLRQGEIWYTPSTPLLQGTQRRYLLEQGLIREKELLLTELNSFSAIGIINTFFDLTTMPRIPLQSVFR